MSDPLDLTPAREALAAHAHDPREVCPTCCDDVCDPCVYALRDVVAEVDRLTAELSGLRTYLTRSIADDIGGMDEVADIIEACPKEDMDRVYAWCDAMRDPSYWSEEVKRLTAAHATAHAEGRRAGLEEAAREADRRYAAWRDAKGFAGMTRAALELLESTGTALRALAAKVTP